MGRLHLRKNNIGKAIIRFLIGLLVLAILVWLLYEFVLTGEFNSSPRMDNVLTLNGTQPAQTSVASGTTAAIPLPVDTMSAAEPTATPTPTPTPTPDPETSPIPDTAFSSRVKDLENLKKWKIDGKKVTNGLTQFELPESNSSRLIRLTGWGYVEDANFDGQHCQMYILVLDSKNRTHVYEATIAPGITGMGEHDGKGKNLSDCDFTAMIDVSSYPDGDYQVGVGIQYTSNKKTLRYAHTFGDAYKFTVVGGAVTAINGVEH